MNTDHLIQRVNRVGQFFEAQPDRDQALADAAAHLHRFWAPGVRQEVSRCLREHGGQGLSPFIAEALARHPEALATFVHDLNPSPTQKASTPP